MKVAVSGRNRFPSSWQDGVTHVSTIWVRKLPPKMDVIWRMTVTKSKMFSARRILHRYDVSLSSITETLAGPTQNISFLLGIVSIHVLLN